MSREEAYKILDKVLDSGFCGEFVFDCFKGAITNVIVKNQYIKSSNDLVVVAVTK